MASALSASPSASPGPSGPAVPTGSGPSPDAAATATAATTAATATATTTSTAAATATAATTTVLAPSTARPDGAAVVAQIIEGVKVYGKGEAEVRALDGINAAFSQGQFTAIMGPSGSGKSTLLHCLAGLDRLTSGRALIGQVDLAELDDKALTLLRRERFGFVFQAFNLVPTLTAGENMVLPLTLGGKKVDPSWARQLAASLRVSDRLGHRPAELSGGQQQRVAMARALVTKPSLLFADEPTGNLDSRSATELLGQIRHAVDEYGQTVVMVTHDPRAAGYADRAMFLADGQVVGELAEPTVRTVLDAMRELEK